MAATKPDPARYTFVVEHLDPELGPWSELEYKAINQETMAAGSHFILSSVNQELISSGKLEGVVSAPRSDAVEHYFANKKQRICLLDPAAEQDLQPDDAMKFDVFLFGGILGDNPPRDRTSELRKKGFQGRRLGSVQMTTDTAVRVTRMVTLEQKCLQDVPYVDFPELQLDQHEFTEMPFRYVKAADGSPVMPSGMLGLIKDDADKAFDGLEFAEQPD